MTLHLRYVLALTVVLLTILGGIIFSTYGFPPEEAIVAQEPTTTISYLDQDFTVLLAVTGNERMRGLSGRESLDPAQGMFFVFESDGRHALWMKDMLISLDIIWIDVEGSVVHIEHSLSPDTYPQSFMPPLPARYVLEVPAGFATEHGIEVGSKLEFSL